MIAELSERISLMLMKSNAINQEKLNVCKYGMQILILEFIDWSITFLFILIVGHVYLSALYFLVFFALRRHCGGYHAKTHIRCIVISNAVYVLSISTVVNMHYENLDMMVLFGEIINLILIQFFSPAEHPNKSISATEIIRHKKWGRILNAVIGIIALSVDAFGDKRCACVMIMAQFSVSIAVILQKIKNCFGKEVLVE